MTIIGSLVDSDDCIKSYGRLREEGYYTNFFQTFNQYLLTSIIKLPKFVFLKGDNMIMIWKRW